MQGSQHFQMQRAAMVRSIDEAVPTVLRDAASFGRALDAISAVKREDFVSRTDRARAYEQRPQPIGYDQTISNPYIVTIMTAAANPQPGGRVLEIGTGSGYQAAVLSRLTDAVYSIEIVEPLARSARRRLRRLGYANVRVRAGDGSTGWPEAAPFDAIVVTAGAASPPPALLQQLRPGGRLVMPVGPSTFQERLTVFTLATDGSVSRCILGSAMFVPLTGRGARPSAGAGLAERGIGYCYGEDAGRWDFEPVRTPNLQVSRPVASGTP